jgi:Ca2+-binding EF-hand superfamily protein
MINDYNISQNKYNYSINNNNSNYYFKYNTNYKDDFQNNNITYSEYNDDILNNNMPYNVHNECNECNEFNGDIINNCYDDSNINNNYEFQNESCYQNNNNNYEINDYYCCDNDDTNNQYCQDIENQVDYNNNKCQNNNSLYSPFRIRNISDSLSLRTSPRRMRPPNESRNDDYNNRRTYFSPFYQRRPKNNDKINSNYDVDNSNIYSNSEYNFSYKPKKIKKNRSQNELRINRDNIFQNNYNNNYSNNEKNYNKNNNSFEKEKKILCHYFKLAMEGESQIELTKVNLILRKDFNCTNFYNLFDEENKGFITFDDLKNELEFIGLPMKDIEIQLLINRFNKTNNNNGENEEENIIEFDNFCSCLLPSSNKYEDLCNEKIKNRNTNEPNIFSPTTRLYIKTLIKAMVDLEKKLNKFKKNNINKDINFIDVLKEIDVSEKGYFGINELIRFLKEHGIYSCYKDSELLFNRLDKKERNKVTYDDIFTDLYYL